MRFTEVSIVEETSSDDIESTLKELASSLNTNYGFEIGIKRSNLGPTPSYFFSVYGPKSTWQNDIALNSPIGITFSIFDLNSVETERFSYQMKDAGIKKLRKFRFKSADDLKRKIEMYFATFKDALASLSEPSLTEETLVEFDINNAADVQKRIYTFKRKAAESKHPAEKATFERALAKLLKKLEDLGVTPEDEPRQEKPRGRARPDNEQEARARAREKEKERRRNRADADDRQRANDRTSNSGDQFKIVFVGHFQQGTSDKVWGWGAKGDTIYQFWGRRGAKPQLKTLPNTDVNRAKLDKLGKSKAAKGYEQTSAKSFEDWIRKVLETDPKFSG